MYHTVRNTDIQREAIERATKLAARVKVKVDEVWGQGPMTQTLSPAEVRNKLKNDPAYRQQALEVFGPDKVLEALFGSEVLKSLGVS